MPVCNEPVAQHCLMLRWILERTIEMKSGQADMKQNKCNASSSSRYTFFLRAVLETPVDLAYIETSSSERCLAVSPRLRYSRLQYRCHPLLGILRFWHEMLCKSAGLLLATYAIIPNDSKIYIILILSPTMLY